MSLKSIFRIETKKLFQTILLVFIAVQVISWVISSVLNIPMLKGGWVLFLFLITIILTTFYSMGVDIKQISLKRDIPILLLMIAIMAILYLILPIIVPQIFSVSGMEVREFLKGGVSAVVQVGTGVVG